MRLPPATHRYSPKNWQKKRRKKRQKGAVSVEFAMLGVFFLLFLLVIIDIGRWMMTMGLLQEASHRVARTAAVSNPCIADINDIKRKGLFATLPGNPNQSATIPGLSVDHFSLDWLGSEGNHLSGNEPDPCDIQFTRSAINDFEFLFFSPVNWFGALTVPDFQVTVYRESLGWKSQQYQCSDSNTNSHVLEKHELEKYEPEKYEPEMQPNPEHKNSYKA